VQFGRLPVLTPASSPLPASSRNCCHRPNWCRRSGFPEHTPLRGYFIAGNQISERLFLAFRCGPIYPDSKKSVMGSSATVSIGGQARLRLHRYSIHIDPPLEESVRRGFHRFQAGDALTGPADIIRAASPAASRHGANCCKRCGDDGFIAQGLARVPTERLPNPSGAHHHSPAVCSQMCVAINQFAISRASAWVAATAHRQRAVTRSLVAGVSGHDARHATSIARRHTGAPLPGCKQAWRFKSERGS